MPRAVIADDEPLLAEDLRRRLAALWPELDVAAVLGDGVAALAAINRLRPDFASTSACPASTACRWLRA